MHAAPFVPTPTPAILLTSSMVGYSTWAHIMLSCAYLVNSCAAAVALRYVVARAKKCWDFGGTIYIIHGIATMLYEGINVHWPWWSILAASMVSTILLGEYLCVRLEMADIPMHSSVALPGVLLPCTAPKDCSKHLQSMHHASTGRNFSSLDLAPSWW